MLTAEENKFLTETGPGTPMGELFRRYWMPALLCEELPAPDCPPVRVKLLGEDLVAFRDSDGTVGLLDAHCPHRLADLFFGRNEECGLRCVYHGWKFDVDGNCVDMPNEPTESNFKSKIRTTAYPCEEHAGMVWAYMGPKDHLPEFPHLQWDRVPESHRVTRKVWGDCSYLAPLEGEVDNSHVGWLHWGLQSFSQLEAAGKIPRSKHAQSNYVTTDRSPRAVVKDTEYGLIIGWQRNADPEHYQYHIQQWLMPFCTQVRQSPGLTQLALCRIPADDNSSWWYLIEWNPERPLSLEEIQADKDGRRATPVLIPGTFIPEANRKNDYMVDRALQRSYSYTGMRTSVGGEDVAITESQGVIVDRTKEHLGSADVGIIALRRKLVKAATDLQQGIEPPGLNNPAVYSSPAIDGLLPRDVPFDEYELMVATGVIERSTAGSLGD